MWKCRHCGHNYNFENVHEKANHSRWCDKNPKRDNWNKGQGTIGQFGPLKEFEVICECCSGKFVVNEREKLHPQKNKYYCSRACANNRQKWWNENLTNYRTIAFKNWKQECAICGFDKIVAVHHIDNDHNNDEPRNLIPLCPNHHEMAHSKWYYEVESSIRHLVEAKWGIGASGNTLPLQGRVKGSTPLSSTISKK